MQKFLKRIEHYLPMTWTSLLLFVAILYLFYIVGRSVWINYNSNKDIEQQEASIIKTRQEIKELNNEINYYQTKSFKEKEARAKLGYKAPGETVVAVPLDRESKTDTKEKIVGDVQIRVPNQVLWWRFFFGG